MASNNAEQVELSADVISSAESIIGRAGTNELSRLLGAITLHRTADVSFSSVLGGTQPFRFFSALRIVRRRLYLWANYPYETTTGRISF